jgi:peptidoglycan-associated lipoprotein
MGGEEMVKSYLKFVAIGAMMSAVMFMTSGCAKKQCKPAEEMGAKEAPTGSAESLESKPAEKSPFAILEGRTTGPMLPVYFDFDKSAIRKDQKSRIETNATYLKDNPNAMIEIQGNCDERGTNEYNMALGQRRANSAEKYLVNLGVAKTRLTTISFGKEKPLNFGHDELAWSQNRRDDFVQNQ